MDLQSKARLLKKRFVKNCRAFWRASIFVQSDRLGRFLRYTVETTLAGDAETLKEYLIGTEVYERKPPLPSQCGLRSSQRGPEAPQQIKGILRVNGKKQFNLYLLSPR
jgi:hypothetical protein